MEVKDIYLCIHYNKKIDLNGRVQWIQPGDMEISYFAGTKKYAFIGFCDCGSDAGTLVFATDDQDEVKSFMTEKRLKFDFRYVYNSELLDFHENFQKDTVGQWRVVGLEGTVEIEDEYAESASDWSIQQDLNFCMTDRIDREALRKAFEDNNAKCSEILKCQNDITYFIEHYVKLPDGGKIVLKDWQKEYLKHLVDGNDAMLSDMRRAGKTSINAIYAIWSANFHPPSRCTFITCAKQMSSHTAKFVIDVLNLLPRWLCSTHKIDMYKKTHIRFSNRSDIAIVSANADFCGYYPGKTLVLDDVELYSETSLDNAYYGLVPVLKSYKNSQLIMTYSSGSDTRQISEFIMNAAIRGQLFFGETK